MEWLLEITKQYGISAGIIVWVLYTNREREEKYIAREEKYLAVIQTLTDDVKERLTKIETFIRRK